jgi:hypothetical protein
MSDNELKDYQPTKAVINKPLDWANTLFLSEQAKSLRLFRDKDNNLLAMPVIMFDPSQAGSNILAMGKVGIADPQTVNSYARAFGLPGAGWPDTTIGLVVHATQMVEKFGSSQSGIESQRTPTTFKYISGINAVGPTHIWTPAGGKKFRLLGGIICLSKDAACAGALVIKLFEEAVQFMTFDISLAALVAIGNVVIIPIVLPANGYFSTVADRHLDLLLTGALTAGSISVNVWGTEE